MLSSASHWPWSANSYLPLNVQTHRENIQVNSYELAGLLKGFKNSPTLFDEALSIDMLDFRQKYPQRTLLHYVDDLLVASTTEEQWR